MNYKKYATLFIVLMASLPPIVSKKVQIFDKYELGRLDPDVKEVCQDYLRSKGFEPNQASLNTLKKRLSLNNPLPATRFDVNTGTLEFEHDDEADEFWKNIDAYAFTIREKKAIVLSPGMIASIKYSLQQTGQLTLYDKYVLLHEVGHLFPYGLDYEKAREKDIEKLTPFFLRACCLIPEVMIGGFIVDAVKHFNASSSTVSCVENSWYALLGVTSVAAIISLIPYLYSYSETQKIADTFEKTKLHYSDPQFNEHMATVLEERDADIFALSHFSQEELEEYVRVYALENETVRPEEFIEREYLTLFERYAFVKSLLDNKTTA